MRITNGMIINRVLSNLNNNMEHLAVMQDQLSSGKTVSKPSDNPVYVSRIMRLQSMVVEQERYQKTMEDALSFVDNAESALGTVTGILNRARELAIFGANGTNDDNDRLALAAEVDELIDELLEVANSSFDGRYIFGGTKTEEPPFERTGDTINYSGNEGEMLWEVSRNVTIQVNIPGEKLFKFTDGDIFDALTSLKSALESGNTSELGGVCLDKVDKATNHVLSQRAVLGARSNRLAVAQDRIGESKLNLTELLSKLEDIDIAEATINFATARAVYNASLATGAQVIQPTLLDYLR